jgi:hypothetical protein
VSRRLAATLLACTATALALPAAAPANHVSINAGVGARVVERSSSGSWVVEVSWSARCIGATDPGFSGNLYLIDAENGNQTHYLGGVFSASGRVRQLVSPGPSWRRLAPLLRLSCFDESDLHGSPVAEVAGSSVLIPPRYRGAGGGGQGGGGQGGGSGGGGDPTQPPRGSGCERALFGTALADELEGSGRGDVVFGLGGSDRILGRGGNDCLLGARGADLLRGEEGHDRLTGEAGPDVLVGGAGLNAYDAGRGADLVKAANGRRELVRCGPGRDRVRADRGDRLRACERITRVG